MGPDWPMPALPPASDGPLTSQPLARRSSPLSPTGALRARQKMDAAQQATSELSVLTEQLLDLPVRLERVRLAAAKGQQIHEAMEAFAELAALAYLGMAEGRLAEVAGSALYRQRAVAASRRINRLQQDAAVSRPLADPLTDLADAVHVTRGARRTRTPGRVPAQRLRTRLYHEALLGWRAALATDASTAAPLPIFGRALEGLRAAVGFAGIPTPLLIIIRTLVFVALAITGVITAVAVGAAASALTLGQTAAAARFGVAALFLAVVWGVALTWGATGRTTLRTVLGATRWRLVERERATGLGLLTGWTWFAAPLALLALVASIGYAGWLLAGMVGPGGAVQGAHDLASWLSLGSREPLELLVVTVATVLALPLVVALPPVLTYAGMLGREMARGTARLPQARAVAVRFALPLLAYPTLVVLGAALVVAQRFPALMRPFVTLGPGQISWIAPLVAGCVIVPYLVAVARPFNAGVRRWRRARLGETQAQEQELSAKLDQLAPAPDPAADVATVQYDVARLQYLRLHTEELRRERSLPFGAGEHLVALLIVLALSILTDSGLALALRHGLGR